MLCPSLVAPNHLKPRLGLRSGYKNRALNFRVMLNEKNAYEDSKPMLRPSVPRQRQRQPQRSDALADPPPPSSVFKSRVLNPIHLNQIVLNNNELQTTGKRSKNAVANTQNNGEKHQMEQNWKESQKDRQSSKNGHKRGSQPLAAKTICGAELHLSSDNYPQNSSSDIPRIKNLCHRASLNSLVF